MRGLQGPDPLHPRAIATPKHLAAHSGPEAGRDAFDVDISPYDREATYLPAFRMAVIEGRARSIMCAYNSIHGVPACASAALLDETVRRDWGFRGLVVSDCDAVGNIASHHHYRADAAEASAAALAAGMDLNCGRTYAALGDAVRRGLVPGTTLDTAVARAFAARRALGGAFGTTSPWDRIPPAVVDSAAHRLLALEAARKSIVLLKNDARRLPLAPGTRIAVIGPNADSLDVLEGNYHGTAAAPVTPLQGMRERFQVAYAQGSSIAEGVAVTVPETALALTAQYFAGAAFAGEPRVTRRERRIDLDFDRASPAPGLGTDGFAVRFSGTIEPPAAGDYRLRLDVPRCFDCTGHDPVRLWIDGKRVLDDGGEGREIEAPVRFDDGRAHQIRVELVHRSADEGLRLGWIAPPAAQLAEADAAIASADAVVALVGLSPAVEGEALGIEVPGFSGGDRTDIGLPAAQMRLLERAKASGKPLVVVLISGSAVAIAWAKTHADAVIAAWYPGQAGGTAIADVLSGAINPAGRLPVTFYARTRDLPAFIDYSMRERTYRYFTGTPLWSFGHGLSYARFAYARLPMPTTIAAGDALAVDVDVTNAGAVVGDEVVQAYLTPPEAVRRIGGSNDPVLQRALVGFQRIALNPGETRRVRFAIDPRSLSSVDRTGVRRVMPGDYRLHIGGGQPGDGPGFDTHFAIRGTKELPR